MKKTMLTSFIMASLLGAGACKSPVVPLEKQRTPREYTWTKTGLGEHTYPFGIWGSSPQNVYLVAGSPYLFTGKIWHFDGSQWRDITAVYTESFPVANPGKQAFTWTASRVWGFGPDDIWIVGTRILLETLTFPDS